MHVDKVPLSMAAKYSHRLQLSFRHFIFDLFQYYVHIENIKFSWLIN